MDYALNQLLLLCELVFCRHCKSMSAFKLIQSHVSPCNFIPRPKRGWWMAVSQPFDFIVKFSKLRISARYKFINYIYAIWYLRFFAMSSDILLTLFGFIRGETRKLFTLFCINCWVICKSIFITRLILSRALLIWELNAIEPLIGRVLNRIVKTFYGCWCNTFFVFFRLRIWWLTFCDLIYLKLL